MADLDGIVPRTTRADTPVIYEADEDFPVGGSKTVRSTDDDDVTIVAAGITLHEALAAADRLAEEDVAARVIDLYSVKPIDAETIRAIRTPIVTAEDRGRRAASGRRCWRRSPTSRTDRPCRSSPCASFRTRASRPSSWPQPGSTPRRSPPPHEPSSGLACPA